MNFAIIKFKKFFHGIITRLLAFRTENGVYFNRFILNYSFNNFPNKHNKTYKMNPSHNLFFKRKLICYAGHPRSYFIHYVERISIHHAIRNK